MIKELLSAIDSLDLADLRKLEGKISARRYKMEEKAKTSRMMSRLVKVEVSQWAVAPSDVKRFVGGFFREQRPSGNLGGRLYAKTKTGILYEQDRFGRSWEKVTV
jgi:hypothetical protein